MDENQQEIKLTISPLELRALAKKAQENYDMLPDDKSIFPEISQIQNLRLGFLNLYQMADGLADILEEMSAEKR